MFTSTAYAQTTPAPTGGAQDLFGGLSGLVPLVLIFVLFYFLLIRPQQKKMKQHKDMISAVKRGDQVILGGGIRGKVVKVADDEALVEIADGVRVRVVKATITDVVAKAEPFKEKDEDGDKDKKEGGEAKAS